MEKRCWLEVFHRYSHQNAISAFRVPSRFLITLWWRWASVMILSVDRSQVVAGGKEHPYSLEHSILGFLRQAIIEKPWKSC